MKLYPSAALALESVDRPARLFSKVASAYFGGRSNGLQGLTLLGSMIIDLRSESLSCQESAPISREDAWLDS